MNCLISIFASAAAFTCFAFDACGESNEPPEYFSGKWLDLNEQVMLEFKTHGAGAKDRATVEVRAEESGVFKTIEIHNSDKLIFGKYLSFKKTSATTDSSVWIIPDPNDINIAYWIERIRFEGEQEEDYVEAIHRGKAIAHKNVEDAASPQQGAWLLPQVREPTSDHLAGIWPPELNISRAETAGDDKPVSVTYAEGTYKVSPATTTGKFDIKFKAIFPSISKKELHARILCNPANSRTAIFIAGRENAKPHEMVYLLLRAKSDTKTGVVPAVPTKKSICEDGPANRRESKAE